MRRLGRPDFWTLVTLLGYAIVILLLVLPLFNIFKFSFMDKETGLLSLADWREFFTKKYYSQSFLNTMFVSVRRHPGALVLGVPLAFFTSRYRIFGRSLLSTLAVLALLSPPFIGAYSWIMLLGRRGFLRLFLLSLGIRSRRSTARWASSWSTRCALPLRVPAHLRALTTVDRCLEEAAENLGARAWGRFFRVTLPLVLPSVTAGGLLAFMMCLSNFDTPMIIGGDYRVLPTLAPTCSPARWASGRAWPPRVTVLLILCALGGHLLQR